MIFFIASFDGNNIQNSSHSGGASKIIFLLNILSSIEDEVVVIDTSFIRGNFNKLSAMSLKKAIFNANIKLLSLPTHRGKYFTYIFNLLNSRNIITNPIISRFKPDIVWAYNAGALEMALSSEFKKKFDIKLIIEFEDWIFARGGRFRPKNILDWLYWKMTIKHFDYGFPVNVFLKDKLDKHNIETYLLPGVCPEWVENSASNKPFSNNVITVGYFGGLTDEKGANMLLRMINSIHDENVKFIVTGWGVLEKEFIMLSEKYPSRLKFFGRVTANKLSDLMKRTDVVLNPHKPNDGIFPFKIIEAIASRKLLISTYFNCDEIPCIKNAIEWCDYHDVCFTKAVLDARTTYIKKRPFIDAASDSLLSQYGADGVGSIINKIILQY